MTPYPVTQAYKSVVDAEQETPDDFKKDHELHFSAVQVSISPTFYEQLLRQIPFAKKLETQIVST